MHIFLCMLRTHNIQVPPFLINVFFSFSFLYGNELLPVEATFVCQCYYMAKFSKFTFLELEFFKVLNLFYFLFFRIL